MASRKKVSVFIVLMAALFLMGADAGAPEPARQPGQFTQDAAEAYEANRDKVKAQMKGYSAEDEKRKEIEARQAYEERMVQKRGKDWKEKELREYEEDMERRYGKDWMKDERRQRQYETIKDTLYGKDWRETQQ